MATHPKVTKMANYSCECVEASHIFLKKPFGECERMYRVRAKQGGEFSEFLSQVVLYTKKSYFLCIKRSSLPSPNLPNSPNLLNTRQIRRRESQIFPKNAILASASTRQKCRNFGKYSHSPISLASCHCLKKTKKSQIQYCFYSYFAF